MRYPASEKLEIIRIVEQSHLPAKRTLDQLGIARRTFYRWYDRYLAGGPEALADRPSAPGRVWNRIAPEVQDQIVEMALEQSELSPRELAVRFTDERQYFVSEATVYRLLKAHDLITSPAYVVVKAADAFHTKTTRPNEMWQTDFTYFKIIGWGWMYLSTVLDDFSRYIIAWKLCTNMRAEDVTDTLDVALVASGCDSATVLHKPRLLSDNGPSYIAGELAEYIEANKMSHVRGAPMHPQTQGKIERFHQTLKRWLAARPTPADLPELQGLLDQFQHWYNTARPHRARGRQTPAAAYAALPKASPETDRDSEWRTRTDKVDKNGKISLRYAGTMRHLGVGRRHIGLAVLLLIHDRDVTVSDAATGEVIACHHIDPARDYQAPLR